MDLVERAGRAAEQALLDAVEGSKQSPLASRLRGILFDVMVGRRSLEQAIEADEAVRSAARVYPAMRLLALAAARDAASSGQVVLRLAEFERLRHDAAESTRTRVRSIVETSRTTVVVFAPLILGITAGPTRGRHERCIHGRGDEGYGCASGAARGATIK